MVTQESAPKHRAFEYLSASLCVRRAAHPTGPTQRLAQSGPALSPQRRGDPRSGSWGKWFVVPETWGAPGHAATTRRPLALDLFGSQVGDESGPGPIPTRDLYVLETHDPVSLDGALRCDNPRGMPDTANHDQHTASSARDAQRPCVRRSLDRPGDPMARADAISDRSDFARFCRCDGPADRSLRSRPIGKIARSSSRVLSPEPRFGPSAFGRLSRKNRSQDRGPRACSLVDADLGAAEPR